MHPGTPRYTPWSTPEKGKLSYTSPVEKKSPTLMSMRWWYRSSILIRAMILDWKIEPTTPSLLKRKKKQITYDSLSHTRSHTMFFFHFIIHHLTAPSRRVSIISQTNISLWKMTLFPFTNSPIHLFSIQSKCQHQLLSITQHYMPKITEKHIENNETTNTLTHDTIITPEHQETHTHIHTLCFRSYSCRLVPLLI